MTLLVKTFLKESTIPKAGIGCFAGEPIKKGVKIWQYNPVIDKVYTSEEFDSITGLEKDFLKMYCYKNRGKYILCVDNARFFNHSIECNTFDTNDFEDELLNATYAGRDIAEGEEILSDYRTFGTKEDLEFNYDIGV